MKKPITPRGTRTFLSENSSLDRTHAKVGTRDDSKLSFELLHQHKDDATNKYYSRREFSKADEATADPTKWNDRNWINELNKFRLQTIERVFRWDKEYTDAKTSSSAYWFWIEDEWMKLKIIKVVKKYNDVPKKPDFEKISKAHTERFVGTTTQAGERKPNGKIVVETSTIPRRDYLAIQAHYNKNNELKNLVQKLIDECNTPERQAEVLSSSDGSGDDSSDEYN